jgi:uncharacterized protein YkwD
MFLRSIIQNNEMFMKRLIPFLILLLITIISRSQNSSDWPIKKLDTAREVTYLSTDEKDVILELNKVRYNPVKYAQENIKWMEIFYEGKLLKIPGKEILETNEGKTAFEDCIKHLEKSKPVPLLYPSRGMSKACSLLVYDQSQTGSTGHRGSGNTTPADRIKNFGTFEGDYAENIHYGDCEPTFVVISLLIDDGVRSRGHRKNILDPSFNFTGVAIGKHKIYGKMCVNTFATSFRDN